MLLKLSKWLGAILAIYVIFVVIFETFFLGMYQPSFEESGIPMLTLTTTDDSGESRTRMLARFETDGQMYVSAHHWPRGWFKRALKNPDVRAAIDDIESDYTAVVVKDEEFKRVALDHPLSFMVRFLMGFPPQRDILRLDPAPKGDLSNPEAT